MANSQIYTITANPALDLSGHVSRIVPNEKNYVHDQRIDPGGNGINAARMAKRLGSSPILLGFLGGEAGDHLKKILDHEGLTHRFTPIQGITRTNVTVTNDEDHRQTRFTFPGPKLRRSEIESFLKSLRGLRAPGILVLGGSTPSECAPDFFQRVIRTAAKRGLGVVVDVPVPHLKSILNADLGKLLLIKPNQIEFEDLLGKRLSTDLEIAREACKLLPKCELVCISLAKKGAIVAWNHQAWLVRSPVASPKGTVGAGDSMVGAIVARLAQNGISRPEHCLDAETILDVIRWGTAAGAATATTEGTALGKASLIRSIYPVSTVRRLALSK